MSADIKTIDLTLPIAMRHIGNERKAIEEKLNALQSKYVPEMDGVLINWTDLNVINDKGAMLDDQPFVFWKVSFTAKVFKPIEGKIIKGKINRLLKKYFVAQTLGSFTITVTIPESFLEHPVVQNLMIDQEVYIKVKGSMDGIYRGDLDEECLELTEQLTKENEFSERDEYDYAKDFEY